MAYTHTTFGQLKTQLALRLGDAGNVYWYASELGEYIKEALRTWGLFTSYWRDRGSFTTVANTSFYDISTLTNNSAEALLSSAVTDRELITSIQHKLLEPATGSSWTGSEQFTLADIAQALHRRRDQFLLETGCTLTYTENLTTVPPVEFYDLPEEVSAIRRLAFKGVSGTVSILSPEGVARQRNYHEHFLLGQNPPLTYSSDHTQTSRIRLAPPTNEPGTFNLISINVGATFDPAANATFTGIPDDMTHIIQWGAMADVLRREGPGRDMPRAYFCERRYKLGVMLARLQPVVLAAELNGLPMQPVPIYTLDNYLPDWQTTTGTPEFVATSRNLVALGRTPNNVFSIMLDVVSKAIVPATDGDYVQVGKEELDVIIDYAMHLACFKMGGMEFRATYKGADNFYEAAVRYNRRVAALNPNSITIMKQSIEDFFRNPYMEGGGVGTLQEDMEEMQ